VPPSVPAPLSDVAPLSGPPSDVDSVTMVHAARTGSRETSAMGRSLMGLLLKSSGEVLWEWASDGPCMARIRPKASEMEERAIVRGFGGDPQAKNVSSLALLESRQPIAASLGRSAPV
jgi:hypothetical protein